jgi:DNA-binding beta-propeller fold protein YncE
MKINFSICLCAMASLIASAPASAQRFLGTIATTHTPAGLAIDTVNNKIYVSDRDSTTHLNVIDGATNAVSTIGTLPTGSTPGVIAYTSAGSGLVYVANTLANGTTYNVTRIPAPGGNLGQLGTNPALAEPLTAIATDSSGNAWAIGASGVYKAGATAATTLTGPFNGSSISGPAAIAINQTGGRLYVANKTGMFAGTVTEFPVTNTPAVSSHTVGSGPQAIIVNNTTNKVYVANGVDGTVTVFDGSISTNVGAKTVIVGSNPIHIAINETTNKVYVVNQGENSVTVINGAPAGTLLSTPTVAATITGFTSPIMAAVNPVTNRIYVLNSNNTVTTISGGNNLAVGHPTNLGGPLAGTQGLVVNPATNRMYIADGTANQVAAFVNTDTLRDFNADGRADVFWLHATLTQTYEWQMNGAAISASGSPASTGDTRWQGKGIGDFDGDGRADILFRNETDGSGTGSGATAMWLMNGTTIASSGSPGTVADLGWQVQGVGDFNGDGKADILWVHTDGTVLIWFMNGTAISSSATVTSLGPSSPWSVQGIGDFNGDGKADVLWLNTDGTVLVWLMNGATIASSSSPANVGPTTATAWTVQGVGDFNGDGMADILWRNDDLGGIIYVWLMNGASIASAGSPTSVGTTAAQGWVVKGVGDYSGDGKADVFWKNDMLGGITYVWLMNGAAITSANSVTGVPDTNWQVQNPH